MKPALLFPLSLLLALTACGGQGEQPPVPSDPAPAVSPAPAYGGVRTDWSVLEDDGADEPPELLYSRWYRDPVHQLIPLEGGYGTLVPFVGSFPPDLGWGGVYQYGLMTMDGTIVVDTTYSDVELLFHFNGDTFTRLPVLSLMETEYTPDPEQEYVGGTQKFGACALDGSWALPVEYDGIRAFAEDGFFLWKQDMVYVYGLGGELLHTISYPGTADLSEYDISQDWNAGVLSVSDGSGGVCFLDLSTGKTVPLEGVSGTWWIGGDLFAVQTGGALWGCMDKTGRWIVPAQYRYIYYYDTGTLCAETNGDEMIYFNFQGQEIPEPEEPESPAYTPQPGSPFPDAWPVTDYYTGDLTHYAYYERSTDVGYEILTREGEVLSHLTASNDAGTQGKSVINGLVLVVDDLTAGYKDLEGNWVFRVLLAEAGED